MNLVDHLSIRTIQTAIIVLFATIVSPVAGASSPQPLEASMPVEGGIFKQFGGKTLVFFIYHLTDEKDRSVKIQVSSTPDFKNVVMERTLVKHRASWATKLSGKFYWRLYLEDNRDNILSTTKTRTFLIAPDNVNLAIDNKNTFTFEHKKPVVTFHWSTKIPAIKPLFYRFKISMENKFNDPLVNVDLHELTYTTNQLGRGYYYYKIGVKWSEELPIQYSDTKVFVISKLTKPAATAATNPESQKVPDQSQDQAKNPAMTGTSSSQAAAIPTQRKSVGPTAAATAKPTKPTSPLSEPPELAVPAPPKIAIIAPKPPVKKEPPQPLPTPILFAPLNDTAVETIDESVAINLQWKSPGRAKQFVIDLSTLSNFDPKEQMVTEEKSLHIQKPKGRYFWRVQAVDDMGIRSPFSASWRFSITKPVISLSLQEPFDKIEETYTKKLPVLTFAWHVSSKQLKPIGYKLQIASDAGFTSPAFSEETKETSASLDNIQDGTYFWRVAAIFRRDDPPLFSDIRSFKIIKKIDPLEPPTLKAPGNQTTEESYGDLTPVTFSWDASARAISFEYTLADNPAFSHASRQNTLDKSFRSSLPCGTFYWRVKGFDKIGTESPYSATASFKIVKSTKSIQLTLPANQAKISSFKVTFSWEELKGCAAYEMIVSTDANMEKPSKIQKTTARTAQVELDDEDKYYWMVQCAAENGHFIKSPIQSFAIIGSQ